MNDGAVISIYTSANDFGSVNNAPGFKPIAQYQAEIAAKMVEGRLRKALAEQTLLSQPFVKDPDQSIEKLLKAARQGRWSHRDAWVKSSRTICRARLSLLMPSERSTSKSTSSDG